MPNPLVSDYKPPGLSVSPGAPLPIADGGTGLNAVGAAFTLLQSTGAALAYALLLNANVDPAAAIAYSKLNLSGSIVNADVNAGAAIAYSKLNLTTSIVNGDVNAAAAIAYSKLNLSGSVVNADVNAAAAIAYSKLNLSGSIVNADVNAGAAIAYSKLNLTTSIVNGDINAAAAIAYSKLNLSGSIVNADVNAAAAIAGTKISPNFGSQDVVTTGSYAGGSGTVASAGTLRFAKNTLIAKVRNSGSTGDNTIISDNGSDGILFGASSFTTTTLNGVTTSIQSSGTSIITCTSTLATFTTPIVLPGSNVATTANIRSPNNSAIISARNNANSANIQCLIVDTNDTVILGGDVGSAAWSLRAAGTTFLSSSSASVIVQNVATWQLSQSVTPTYAQATRSGDNAAIDTTFSAQIASPTSTGTNRNGGNFILRGGSRKAADTNGTQGGVRLCIGASSTAVLVEVCEVINNGFAVVSLCRNAALTSTEMPVNTGNLVVFIGNAGTDPSTGVPVSGGILFASGGALKWKGSGGTVTTLGAA